MRPVRHGAVPPRRFNTCPGLIALPSLLAFVFSTAQMPVHATGPSATRKAQEKAPSTRQEETKKSPRPVIGINLDVSTDPDDEFNVPIPYIDAIEKAGGIPLVIPPMSEDLLDQVLGYIDGLLLIGGPDYPPSLYGEKKDDSVVLMNKRRSDFDLMLAKKALANENLPCLGICAGCQVLNIAAGGSLVQDIPTQFPDSKVHHSSWEGFTEHYVPHPVKVEKGSRLAKLYPALELTVPGAHHQCVKDPGGNFEVVAQSEDGVIEAIELKRPGRFLVGVQWHPERDFEHNQSIFEELVRRAKTAQERRADERKH